MKKKIDLNEVRELRCDDKIKGVLQREFEVPKTVKDGKEKAFAQIHCKEKQDYANNYATRMKKKKGWGVFGKSIGGLAAAAAVFSVVCISNPAMAESIPLIGHIFERIGSSLGFPGDYDKYAVPLEPETGEVNQSETEGEANENDMVQAQPMSASGKVYSSTSNGVTMTLSEVYCNKTTLYLSVLIESEEVFPESFIMENTESGVSYIPLHLYDSDIAVSYEKESGLYLEYIQGKMVDEHTYAGVIPVDFSYQQEIPDTFTMTMDIHRIVGDLPDEQRSVPEIPQDIRDEYDRAMAEQGLDEDQYESFTQEQKDIEHTLFTEMINKYHEKYPETSQHPNSYENWWFEGDWNFEVEIKVNDADTITKEVKARGKEGEIPLVVTKTPFEINGIFQEGDEELFIVALDAEGKMLSYGDVLSANADTWVVQDRDVSKIDIYLCDYMEYMDELKGRRWSEGFKELMDERALYHAEVVFEE